MIIASVSHQIDAIAVSRGMAMGGEAEVVQLREHLHKLAQERCQALEELEEMQWKMLTQRESQVRSEARVNELEYELENSRASERHLLESLASQTKQLEQTKILLEEMKLELRTLRAASSSPRHGKNEAAVLQTELRLALEAEEKSKRAMDGLALALKEVSTESGRLKGELEAARGESERVGVSLRGAEAEAERLKAEAEESVAAWLEKETGFLECIRTSEAELEAARRDCTRAERKHRSAVDEASNLRDIVKQAIKEASVVKEALEIARRENAKLQDVLEAARRELQEAKAREAAALRSFGDMKRMFASPAAPTEQALKVKRIAKYPSDNWRHHSVGGESDRLFEAVEYSPKQRKTTSEEVALAAVAAEGGWDSPARYKLRRGRF
ncbi:WEB family protein At3g02930, chloroplastic-like [Zingiber officinale]|uniref:Uncharacterized protein n=1 Tax=Zingiber officinale TaxID=94328 RepID=A0A8J5GQ31_ZINOF|nr:WEB family protein At3g02930, chloroplastic-like [Zingiber officinale]KAG6512747.1 hypothetical protein ZIOFF_030876 [Zingiber officinale]